MGIASSIIRTREENTAPITTDNNVIPPPNTEAYFLMFGGPPITGSQFLDHNVFYVQSQRPQQHPVVPPEFKETITIQNDMNVLKRTIKIIPINDSHSPQKYVLEFEFDTRIPCDVFIYLIANEFKDKVHNRIVFKSRQSFKKQSFEEGSGHIYKTPIESSLDLTHYSNQDLVFDERSAEQFKFPLVIELRSRDGNCQFTYCTFLTNGTGHTIKSIKQKIMIEGQVYELADIYGFESQMTQEHAETSRNETPSQTSDNAVINIEDTDPDDSKCVVCITDQADTAVLPCRHMCMCYGCAKILRLQTNKCPICRTLIDNLIVVGSDEPCQKEADLEQEIEEDEQQSAEGIASELPGSKKEEEKESRRERTPRTRANV
jgi:hypothetical protein